MVDRLAGFAERLAADFFSGFDDPSDDDEFTDLVLTATHSGSESTPTPYLGRKKSATVKDPSARTIKVADVLERVAEKGIDVYNDPRCKPLLAALRSTATRLRATLVTSPDPSSSSSELAKAPMRERISKAELIDLIRKNAGFFKRIFEAGLIIDNWPHFTNRIEQLYLLAHSSCEDSGKVADYIPQLAKVDPKYWGVSVTSVDGQRLNLGDTNIDFTVQSCSKVISYCIAQEQNGPDCVHYFVGREPSGEQFNALKLDEKGRPHNPCINSGAIMTCSLIRTPTEIAATQASKSRARISVTPEDHDEKMSIPGSDRLSRRGSLSLYAPDSGVQIYAPGLNKTTLKSEDETKQAARIPAAVSEMYAAAEARLDSIGSGSIVLRDSERFEYVCSVWSDLFGGDKLNFNNPTYLSERATGHRNFALAHFMKEQNPGFPPETDIVKNLEFYFQCCSLEANASQMSLLAATLANYGVNPITKKKVFSAVTVQNCLSIMYSCGMYNWSGEHSFEIGIPSKSGVGGCIISVVPGVMGIATFSPRLDDFGNSSKGVEFLKLVSRAFGFHTFQRTKKGRSGIGGNASTPMLGRQTTAAILGQEESESDSEFSDSSSEVSGDADHSPLPLESAVMSSGKLLKKGVSKAKSIARSVVGGGLAPDSMTVYQCVFSASNGDITTLKSLFVKGRDLTIGDYDARTPLHLAASNGYLDVVQFLVKDVYPVSKNKPTTDNPKDSTINPVDRWGNTPVDDAIRENKPKIVQFLKRFGGIEGSKLRDIV